MTSAALLAYSLSLGFGHSVSFMLHRYELDANRNLYFRLIGLSEVCLEEIDAFWTVGPKVGESCSSQCPDRRGAIPVMASLLVLGQQRHPCLYSPASVFILCRFEPV